MAASYAHAFCLLDGSMPAAAIGHVNGFSASLAFTGTSAEVGVYSRWTSLVLIKAVATSTGPGADPEGVRGVPRNRDPMTSCHIVMAGDGGSRKD